MDGKILEKDVGYQDVDVAVECTQDSNLVKAKGLKKKDTSQGRRRFKSGLEKALAKKKKPSNLLPHSQPLTKMSNIPNSSDSIGTANIATEDETARALNDHAPMWRYVTKLDKMGKGGGNISFRCNFCMNVYKGSYCRVKRHLLKIKGGGIASCSRVTNANISEMQKVVEEAELRVKESLPRQVPLPNTSSHNKTIGSSNSSTYYGLDSGLPSLDPKKRKGISGPLEKAFNIGAREQLDREIARMFYTGGLSFHFARNPHYVCAFKNAFPGYVPLGYNALRTILFQKEQSNINRLLEPVKGTWKKKGVTICSDGWSDSQRRPLINIMAVCESGPMFLNAINCEGEQKDKFFISNLLIDAIREIGPEKVVQVVIDNAPVCKAAGLLVESKFQHIFWTPCVVHTLNLELKSICSPSPHPRYDDIMEECGWISKLLLVADTRFASTIVMLKRFKQIKHDLEQMVISERWDVYKEDDVEKARAVKEKILDDYFWLDINYILSFTSPIYEMLWMADTDTPCLHLIYEWYYSEQWLEEALGRVAPHQDLEITVERKKCIKRYFSNESERRKVNEEYVAFASFFLDFSGCDSINDRAFMAPVNWWIVHGASTPTLQSMALKLLGQPCLSSCCERNWSTHNFIHSMRRNKMTPQRAEDLVFVHTNLRLLSRRSPIYKECVSQLWDVGGDGFDSMALEDAGILEIADLSLDEPELETLLFSSVDNVNDE
ncbi:hypothetical protein Dsin_016785 [Dipteronia sinensis]|uniref:BED-type domain-containing protein n=1 Tax=Dipteronia sinensis TaxID=43782 RepID=A0AAE0ADU6_9ROSI|nr:hypothetical protein Dsin_016785 [Dipteronia sinensis]